MLRTDGLPAFADTLDVASHWLETYWSETYPLVDEDAIFRRNALNCFADPMAVSTAPPRAAGQQPQHGTFSLRDIEIAAGLLRRATATRRPDAGADRRRVCGDAARRLHALHESVQRRWRRSRASTPRCVKTAAPTRRRASTPLSAQLAKIDRAACAAPGAGKRRGDGEDRRRRAGAAGGASARPAVGAVRSRQDAIRALDAVADFFRRTEPSSPIPLFVERAKRLVSKDFLEVLADIAPGGGRAGASGRRVEGAERVAVTIAVGRR